MKTSTLDLFGSVINFLTTHFSFGATRNLRGIECMHEPMQPMNRSIGRRPRCYAARRIVSAVRRVTILAMFAGSARAKRRAGMSSRPLRL